MKVHPVSNITITNSATICKLRRLPHIFSKVLELPFYSNTNVSVQETPESFKFIVDTDDDIIVDAHIAAHTIEIFPGVTKVIVRGTHYNNVVVNNEMEVGLWRFRLPEDTQPELATAVFGRGELVVTVPKNVVNLDRNGVWGGQNGRFVLVQ
uniref:uncharacterized protein LOC122583128 n=1 Tax=Erigeron canadensis TaxID=72917 RepID=UPI001CB975A4|nr:uncharacterized protein LOC122583128 [Erigeron canadensis]